MKDLPKFHETFIPILDVLSENNMLHYDELRKKVRDKHYASLPNELLQLQTKSGDILILNRIGWAKAYLKEGGFVEQPIRGQVRITDKGRSALKKGSLSLKELKADCDYITCQQKKITSARSE